LRDTARSGWNSSKLELAEKVIVLSKRTFTLKDLNKNCRLVIRCSGEDLALASWNNSVTGNELSKDSTSGFNTESERANIN